MARPIIEVKGIKETVRTLEKFGVDASDLKTAFQRIGTMVANEAKILAPKQSGALEASIRASKTKNKAAIRAGSAKVPYAGVIHYGWPAHNIEAHPFLTTAVEHQGPAAVRMMDDELHGLIRKYDLER